MLHKFGFKLRPEEYEIHTFETECHLRPDYCLQCHSAGPLWQGILHLGGLVSHAIRGWGSGQGLEVTGLTDKRDWCPLTKLEPSRLACSLGAKWEGDQTDTIPPPPSTHTPPHTVWLPPVNQPLMQPLLSCSVLFDHVLNCKGRQRKASVKLVPRHIITCECLQ